MKGKTKKVISLLLCVVLFVASFSISTAAEGNVPSNVKGIVFDAGYYAANNADVVKALGTSEASLYGHFSSYGVKEGRQGSPVFSVAHYTKSNADLKAAFGSNYISAMNHFGSYGVNETRVTAPVSNVGTDFDAYIVIAGTNYCLTVSGTNVQLGVKKASNSNQIWTLSRQSNGSYKITNKATGKVLDLSGNSKANGTNIGIYQSNNSNAQRWNFYQRSSGVYAIGSYTVSGKVLDVAGDTIKEAANIQSYQYNSGTDQRFSIEKVVASDNSGSSDDSTNNSGTTQTPTTGTTTEITTTIDMNKLSTSGSFTAAGYSSSVKMLNYYSGGTNSAGKHSIGVINLANYNKIELKYATDASAATIGTLALVDASGNVITSKVVPTCKTGWKSPTSLSLDVSSATKNGEMFLQLNNAKNGMIITEIKLVGVVTTPDDSGSTDNSGSTDDSGSTDTSGSTGSTGSTDSTVTQSILPDKVGSSTYVTFKGAKSSKNISYTNSAINIQTVNSSALTQIWKVTLQSNGTYTLINMSNGKALAAKNGASASGTALVLETPSGSSAQSFKFNKTGNNYYLSVSCAPSCAVDVAGGATTDGTTVRLYTYNGTASQLFSISKSSGNYNDFGTPVNLGTGFTASIRGVKSKKHVSISDAIIAIKDVAVSDEQEWIFNRNSNGSYTIKNKSNGKVLDVKGGSSSSGAAVQTYASNGSIAQQWYIYEVGGVYVLVPGCAPSCALDVKGNLSATGTALDIYTYNKTTAQHYKIYESPDSMFVCGSREELLSYFEKSYNDYLNACEYYTNKGFTIYNQNEKNGNHFTTLVNGSKMAHIYWIACESELNVIYSDTNGANLPPQKPAVTTGSYKTTVTQIKGNGSDVTGYIYQLADGSFIIYDGGNAACADEIKNTLTALSGGKEIIVRAWVLTVAESNNYGAFSAFASKYASSIKLETIITAPISEKISSPVSKTYLTSTFKTDAAKFSGAKVCYAHTGMDFTFCNVKMEILFTAEEQYICDVPRVENGSTEAAEFRNTSLVSRIVTDNCNVMMLSNIGLNSARRMVIYYRDYLNSDICQMAENGLGDLSMYIYNVIGAPTLFCPATTNTFNTNTTNKTVRETLAKSVATKKIILLDSAENKIVLDDVVKRDTSASENFTGALNPSTLTVGYEYTCFNADKMYYYFDITAAQAKGVMAYYEANGYSTYSKFEANKNLAATYTKGSEMIHMYWYEIENRMTIVKSPNGANTLPDKALANITGSFETSVTQLKSKQINGMGYVIQLEDGSFIIYDGGYRDTTDTEILGELWGTLNDLTPDGNKIIIRAWIITHPHGDHYGTFINFCNTYAKNVTLETMIVNQITEEVRSMQANDGYLQKYLAADVAKFEGAVICNVYPGMVFDFGSLRMEILGTHHDAFILSTPKGTSNNTCVVSRLITENDQMLLLADAGVDQMEPMAAYFGDYLKSTNCQISHHGVEDCPLIVYRHIKAARLWYPCDTYLYNLTDRDADVRKALKESKYTKEILLHDLTRKTRTLG